MIQVSDESEIQYVTPPIANLLKERRERIEELKDCLKKQEVCSKWMEEHISYLEEQHTQRSAVSKEKIRQLEAKVEGTAEGYRELKSDLQLEQCRTTGAFRCVDNLKQENKKLRIANVLFAKDADQLQKVNKRLQKYTDKLVSDLPDGIFPKDVELLRAGNASLAHDADEAKEELKVVRGIEFRTRNERDRPQEDLDQLKREYECGLKDQSRLKKEASYLLKSNARLHKERVQLQGKDKELRDTGVRFRQIMDSQTNVIAKCWEDIRKLKVSEEAYKIEVWGLDRDVKLLRERNSQFRIVLAEMGYVLKKDFLPSAVAQRMIEQIDKVLE